MVTVEQLTIIKAGLDASAYQAGAKVVDAANASMAASQEKASVSTEKTKRLVVDSGGAFQRYARQIIDNAAEVEKFIRIQEAANRAVRDGRASVTEANQVLEAWRQKLELQTRGMIELEKRTRAATQAALDMAAAQKVVNQSTGVAGQYGTRSTNNKQTFLDALDAAEKLRAGLIPLQAAQDRLRDKSAELNRLVHAGVISWEEYTIALRDAQQAYAAVDRATDNAIAKNRQLVASQSEAAQAQRAAANSQAAYGAFARVSDPMGPLPRAARQEDLQAWSASIDAARARLIPLVAAEQTHAAKLAEINDALAKGVITDAEATEARGRATAAHERATAAINGLKEAVVDMDAVQRASFQALDALVAKYDALGNAVRRAEAVRQESASLRSAGLISPGAEAAANQQAQAGVLGARLQDLEKQIDPVRAAYDRLYRVSMVYAVELEKIALLEREGVLNARAATQERDRLTAAYHAAEKPFETVIEKQKQAKVAHDATTTTVGQQTFAMQQLGIQTVQFFSSIQAGQPIVTAFIQQAHQVVDVALATGTGFRLIGDAIKRATTLLLAWMATPIGATITAITLLVGAVVLLGTMAEKTNRRTLEMQNSLRGITDDYVAAGAAAEKAAKQIAGFTSASSADARASVTTLFATPQFRRDGAAQQNAFLLSQVALDYAATFQKTLPDAMKDFSDAMKDPLKAVQDLNERGIKGFNTALVDTVKNLQQAGDRATAFAIYMNAISTATEGAEHNKTELQKALDRLSQAFTRTGQDGKSFAQVLGEAITSAAAAAVNAFAWLIEKIEGARQLINSIGRVAPGEGQGPAAGAQRFPGADQGVLVNDGAVGLMQLRSAAAIDVGMSPDARYIYDQNLYGGVRYFRQQLTAFNGSIDDATRAYNQGAGGARQGLGYDYLEAVRRQNIDNIPPQVLADLSKVFMEVFSDYARQLDNPEIFNRILQVALLESGGRHYGPQRNPIPGQGAGPPRGIPDSIVEPGPVAWGLSANTTEDLLRDAARVRDGLGLVSEKQREIIRFQELLGEAIKRGDNPAEIARLTETLTALTGEYYRAASSQEQYVRGLEEQAKTSLVVTEGDKKIAETLREIDRMNRERPETAASTEQVARAVNAVLEAQSGIYRTLVADMGRSTTSQLDLAAAYGQGHGAVAQATAQHQAYEQALKLFPQNSIRFKVALQGLTQAYLDAAKAAGAVKIAQDELGKREQIQVLEEERGLLAASYDLRTRRLAQLQGELALKQAQVPLESELAKKYLATVDALTKAQNVTSQMRSGVEAIASGFISAFDQVGQAITNAFIQGNASALNWGNITRGVISSIMNMVVRLGVITPITNALFGRNEGTLWSGLAGLGGGGGAGGGGGGFFSLGGLSSLFNGGFGGGSSSISTFLFGQGPVGALGPQMPTAGLFGSGGISNVLGEGFSSLIPSMGDIGGMFAGFGLGSMLGSLIANSEAQRTNSMIGAGIGSLLLGPLGGILGGGIGALFGPGESVQGWGLRLQSAGWGPDGAPVNSMATGLLPIDRRYYNESGARTFAAADQLVSQTNEYLASRNLLVGGVSIVGGNKNGADYSWADAGSLEEGYTRLRFASQDNEALTRSLQGKTFTGIDKLREWVEGFYEAEDLIQRLEAGPVAKFTQGLNAVNEQFDDAVEKARKYGFAEDELTAARARAIQKLQDERAETLRATTEALRIRRLVAAGDTQEAQLAQQAEDATREMRAFIQTLDDLALTAAERAAQIADLEATQAAERAAIIRRFGEQAAEALRQAGSNIRNYLDQMVATDAYQVDPATRLTNAREQFERDRLLATGGDAEALRRITSSADAYLTAGRDNYAIGDQYWAIFNEVRSALTNLPVVRSYDEAMAAALEAIEEALVNGTIDTNTIIMPTGNIVQIAGGLNTAGINDRLDLVIAGITAIQVNDLGIAGVTHPYLHAIVAAIGHQHETLIQATGVLGMIFQSLYESRVVEVNQHATLVGITATLIALTPYFTAIFDAQSAGNTIAVDVAAAQVTALASLGTAIAATNTILVDGFVAMVNAVAAVSGTSSAGTSFNLTGNAAIVEAVASVNTNQTLGLAALGVQLASINTNQTAALGVLATNIATLATNMTLALNVTNNLLSAVRAAAADTRDKVRDVNQSAGTIHGSIVDVNSSLSTVHRAVLDLGDSVRSADTNATAALGAITTAIGSLNTNQTASLAVANRYAAAVAYNTKILAGAGGILIAPEAPAAGGGRGTSPTTLISADTGTGILAQDTAVYVGPRSNTPAYAGGQRQASAPIVAFADGGVFDRPGMSPMAIFAEAGPEALMPLARTASGDLGVRMVYGAGPAPAIDFSEVIRTLVSLHQAAANQDAKEHDEEMEMLAEIRAELQRMRSDRLKAAMR